MKSPPIIVLFGEVTYPYTPTLGYAITGTFNIYQNMYFYPRLASTVEPSAVPAVPKPMSVTTNRTGLYPSAGS